VANDKFSVAWCQPIELMQVAGREGECSSHSSAVFFWDIPSFSVGGCYFYQITRFCTDLNSKVVKCGVQLKRDGTRWCTGGEVKGKLANGVGSHYPSLLRCIQHYYGWCAHLSCP